MSSEVAASLARFFEQGKGPSHDELNRLFSAAGLQQYDPAQDESLDRVGKLKRVRGLLLAAFEAEPVAALGLCRNLVSVLKARGSFDPSNEHYPGAVVIRAAQKALHNVGWQLDDSGELYPIALGSIDGRQLSDALLSYVRRIQRGTSDTALTIGTAKELLEAAARHVVVAASGEYDKRAGFPGTLVQACVAQGVTIPPTTLVDGVDRDPYRALEQSLVLAALAINRLRNAEGTGHGRPHLSQAERRQGVVAAQTAAAVCYVLLSELHK